MIYFHNSELTQQLCTEDMNTTESITPDNNRMMSSEKSDYVEGEREK